MTNEHVTQEVVRALTERCGLAVENIDLSSRLVEDLGLDSIDAVEMSIGLEKSLGIEFGEHDLQSVSTVSQLVTLATNLIAKKGGSK